MKTNKKAIKNRMLSLFLSLCMVVTLLPTNVMTAQADGTSEEYKWHLGTTAIPENGTVELEDTDGVWEWDGSTKTLTFHKSKELRTDSKNKYEMVALALPAGSTIELKAGVRAHLTSAHADGIYCDGDLTITGQGALHAYGTAARDESDTLDTGYTENDNAIGSGIVCKGNLTVGDETNNTYVYVAANGNSNRIVEVESLITVKDKAELKFASNQFVYSRTATENFIELKSGSVCEYAVGRGAEFIDGYTAGEGGYYYGANATYYKVTYQADGSQSKLYVMVKENEKADLTPTVTNVPADKKFIGWSTTQDATEEESDIPVTADVTLYPVYEALPAEEAPTLSKDYTTQKLSGFDSSKKYNIRIVDASGNAVTSLTLENATEFDFSDYYGTTIYVKTLGEAGVTVDSSEVSQEITAKTTLDEANFPVTDDASTSTNKTVSGITSGYIYKLTKDGNWQTDEDGDGKVEVAIGSSIYIKKEATTDTPESDTITISIAKKTQSEPAGYVDYKNEVIKGLTEGIYTIEYTDGDSQVTDTVSVGADGTISAEEYFGKELTIIKKGDAVTDDSPALTLTVNPRPVVSESSFTITDAANGGKVISGITDEYRYSIDGGEWITGNGDDVTVNPGSSIEIQKLPSANEAKSESLTINVPKATQEAPTDAYVDYDKEVIAGLEKGVEYIITNGSKTETVKADTNGEISISDYIGSEDVTITIAKTGNATTEQSEAKELTIKARPAAPSKDSISVEEGATQTTISGVNTNQEYSTDGGKTWQDCTGTTITVPAGTEVLIRDKAINGIPASDYITIVTTASKTEEATPNAAVDYTAEKLTGLTPNAEYAITVDGQTTTVKADANGTIDLTTYYGKTISIVKKGNGTTTTDSKAQTLTINTKTVAPTEDQFTVDTESSQTGEVIIKNVTSDYEYSTDNGASWTTGTGSDVIVKVGTTVLIRKKATATDSASEAVKIVAGYKSEAATDKAITSANTDKGDVAGSTFGKLRLKATGKNKAIKLNWKKIKEADGYILYGSKCGKPMQKIKTFSGASKVKYTQKKLKKNTYYKYMVVAYKNIDGQKYVIASSKSAHAATNGGKLGNPTKVKVKASKVTVKKGKTKKIKASYVTPKNKKIKVHISKFRYESSNPKVATVTKKGVIKGKSKGSATIYVYAQNGVYKTVKVTVK